MGKDVVIFGGGIAGLTAAHELVIKGHNVTLYESDAEVGGLAKSRRVDNNIPLEHSWRAIAPWYPNFMNLLHRIPFDDTRSVANLFKRTNGFVLPKDLEREGNVLIPPLTLLDMFYIFVPVFRTVTSGPKRNKYHINHENFAEILDGKLSVGGDDRVIPQLGPGLGLDRHRTPLDMVGNFASWNNLSLNTYEHIDVDYFGESTRHNGSDTWKVFVMPTSEAWMNPWVLYLQSMGVSINLNSRLEKLVVNDETRLIESYTISGGGAGTYNGQGKDFVMAIDPTAAGNVIKVSDLEKYESLGKIAELSNLGTFKEIGFYIGYAEKMNLRFERNVCSIVDSEFSILIYFQSDYWLDSVDLGANNITVIGGTVTDSTTPGLLYGLPAGRLRPEQVREEVIFQLTRCGQFQRIIAEDNNGRNFSSFPVNTFRIWNDWSYDESKKELVGDEFWVSTPGSQQLRPKTETEVKNLKMAGVYTDTSFGLWSMEGAVESGKRAAQAITPGIVLHTHQKILPFRITGFVDDMLYNVGMPSFAFFFWVCVILFLIWLFIKFICWSGKPSHCGRC